MYRCDCTSVKFNPHTNISPMVKTISSVSTSHIASIAITRKQQWRSLWVCLTYLGMYLLVFLQEKPVTVRGWARYTNEKWTTETFLSVTSGITTADFHPVVGYHTFSRQSSWAWGREFFFPSETEITFILKGIKMRKHLFYFLKEPHLNWSIFFRHPSRIVGIKPTLGSVSNWFGNKARSILLVSVFGSGWWTVCTT